MISLADVVCGGPLLPKRELSGRMDLKGRFLCRPSAVANAAAMRVGQRARAPSKADAAVDRRRRRGGKDGGVRVRPSAVCSRLSLSLE